MNVVAPAIVNPPPHAVIVERLKLAAQPLIVPLIVIIAPTGLIVVTDIGWLKVAGLVKVVGPLIVNEPPGPVPVIVTVLTAGTTIGAVIGIVVSPGHGLIELTIIPLVQKVFGILPVILPVTLRLPLTLTVPPGTVGNILLVVTDPVLIPGLIVTGTPGVQELITATDKGWLQIVTVPLKTVFVVTVIEAAPAEEIVLVCKVLPAVIIKFELTLIPGPKQLSKEFVITPAQDVVTPVTVRFEAIVTVPVPEVIKGVITDGAVIEPAKVVPVDPGQGEILLMNAIPEQTSRFPPIIVVGVLSVIDTGLVN